LQQGDPIEERYKEYVNRGAVIDQLVCCLNSYIGAAVSNDPILDHIDIYEKQKVITSQIFVHHAPPAHTHVHTHTRTLHTSHTHA
jgi:hypothetical protein